MSAKRTLSNRQWLNLIIISISAMFLLMVLVGRLMNQNSNPAKSSTTVKVALQRIDFESLSVWKDGALWKSSNEYLTVIQIKKLFNHWQKLLNQSGNVYTGEVPAGKTVLLYFSHITQPTVCKISQSKDNLVITFVASEQQFVLPKDDVNLYYPTSQLK